MKTRVQCGTCGSSEFTVELHEAEVLLRCKGCPNNAILDFPLGEETMFEPRDARAIRKALQLGEYRRMHG